MNENEKKTQENKTSEAKEMTFGDWWKKLAIAAKAGLIAGAALVVIIPIVLIIALGGKGNETPNDGKDDTNGSSQDGGEQSDEKIRYTVTVVDQDGNPVEGVTVAFVAGTSIPIPFKTDEEGVSSYNTNKKVTDAVVTAIPSGYTYDKLDQKLYFDANHNIKITVNKLPDFVIKVVDEEGNLVEGVTVQMCDEGGSCRLPKVTDENGEAFYGYENGTFHAQLTEVPEGYTVDDPAAYYDFDNYIATITLTKIAE